MADLIQFLRDRYTEARRAEEGRWRSIPSAFDNHQIEWRTQGGEVTRLVDDQPYSIDLYRKVATEPAPDQFTLDDLDAKLAAVDACAAFLHESEHGPDACAASVLAALARPFRERPDFDGSWLDG